MNLPPLTLEFNEDEMIAILCDAINTYLSEVRRTEWTIGGTCRGSHEFARDYVAHLYSVWCPKTKEKQNKTQETRMKTAEQIREMMKTSQSTILKKLEAEIEGAAKNGRSHLETFLDVSVCSWEAAEGIVNELVDYGYQAKREYISDQRDGDSVKFVIKW